jgi:TetR/AcrR family transcriptional repressor of nem operon
MIETTKQQINRENLLNQGVTLLMEQGYQGTGLKAILDAVQIPKVSFYNCFGSKENFGAEVIQHYIDPFIKQLTTHLQQSEADAPGALQCYFDEGVEELEKAEFKGICLLGNLMGEIGSTSDLYQKSLQSALSRYRDLLQSGLFQAQ